jgi:hypothetical protein
MKEQRRRNVVGKVSNQSHPGRKILERKIHGIRALHRQPLGREFGSEARREISVDLDRGEPADSLEERPRERALAGADFDDEIIRCRIDRSHDPLEDSGIVEKMLPEALARRYLSSSLIST